MAILTQTYDGVPEGSNLAVPPHEIKDTEARYIQDGILDQIGLLRRRGPVEAVTSVYAFADAASGITQVIRPDGEHRVGVLRGTGAAVLSALSSDYTTVTDLTWHGTLPTSPYYLVDAKPAVAGGILIGTSKRMDATNPVQALGIWRGAGKANYSTGTVTIARGSKTVTGSGTDFTANVEPGMFLFATADDPAATTVYVGYVKTVDSATQLTLAENAPWAATGATYTLKSVRGFCPKYVNGRLTTETASTAATGADTTWKSNGLDTGTWALFRASDMAYVGKVASVTSETTITLTANAAVAMDNESYVALRADGNYDLDNVTTDRKVGFLNAVYKERQFFANRGANPEETYRVWYSEPGDPEAVDMNPVAGNFIEVTTAKVGGTNTPVTALAPAFNSLLLLKENESFALVGSNPTQFEVRKLTDDGALSPMSVQQYDGGVLYAGRNGIYYYDGVQSTNIVEERLGDWYRKLVRTFDPESYRMWSMLVRDHYMLFIEQVTPDYKPRRGNTVQTVNRMTISIYLPTMAATFQTNLNFRGAIEMPAETGEGHWFIVNTASGARVCSTNDLFETVGTDAITCTGDTAGPDFYMESKRYTISDALRKKLFKQLQLHYYVGGDSMSFDTVVGLNENGVTSLSTWAKTILAWADVPAIAPTWDSLSAQYSTWDDLGEPRFKVKRIKFLKRSQHFGFRIYQTSASVTHLKLGPWSIGFKPQRPGRV